jgi:hypothetical protein
MDEEWHRKQHDLAEFAKAEGADYYDPESPVLWKRLSSARYRGGVGCFGLSSPQGSPH